jgi:hypothetical protein
MQNMLFMSMETFQKTFNLKGALIGFPTNPLFLNSYWIGPKLYGQNNKGI